MSLFVTSSDKTHKIKDGNMRSFMKSLEQENQHKE